MTSEDGSVASKQQNFDDIWRRLESAPKRQRDPFRTPVLATVHQNQEPACRVVVLRRANAAKRTLTVYTDSASEKCRALEDNPQVAFTFWDPRKRLQVRLTGTAELNVGESVSTEFSNQSPEARKLYQITPEPGQVIQSPSHLAFDGPIRFAKMNVIVSKVDALWLLRPIHQRIRASWTNDAWSLEWVVP